MALDVPQGVDCHFREMAGLQESGTMEDKGLERQAGTETRGLIGA